VRTRHAPLFLLLSLLALMPVRAAAQAVELTGRPIAEVRIEGLDEVPQQLVRNQIRAEAGDPYEREVVENDVARITHLGRFSEVIPRVSPRDGSVVLTYEVTEQPLLQDVRIAGNSAIGDSELMERIVLRPGEARDPFLIDQGQQQIQQAYTEEGYFVADVEVDQQALRQDRELIYRVREGPRVRMRQIRFKGNEVFSDRELRGQIRSDTYFPILKRGVLSREQLQLDAASVREFYRDRGYLDAEVGRRIELSPDQQDAVVTFMVDEGPQYTVGQIEVEGADLFPPEQVRLQMILGPGDIYSQKKLDRSREALRNLYGSLGFIEANVRIRRLFHEDRPLVDLLVQVEPGESYTVGKVSVRGNESTQQRVVLREARGIKPGRTFNRKEVEETRRRLNNSQLFQSSSVTVLGDEADETRDVLIEVDEAQTGRLSFGAGISSDAGLIGAITLRQQNFDIGDPPESFSDLFSGEAFTGAGQTFKLTLQPGSRQSRYSVQWREPYLLESDYSLNTSARYFERDRNDYSEQRMGADWSIGRRFGDVWEGSIDFRGEQVDLQSLQPDAPRDVFAAEGENTVTGLGLSLTRNTVDRSLFPTEGSRTVLSAERVGAMGGDFDFTKLSGRYHKFWTVDEDFIGRRTVFSLRTRVGWIPEDGEAPVFERYYAGGHSTFRGFNYRGAGPRGIRADNGQLSDEAVGGEFMLLAGAEYEFPLVEEWLRGAIFTDQGTVRNSPGIGDWRVSVGGGFRFRVPLFGGAPIAVDFAYPVVREKNDETRIFSFSVDVPLQ